MSVRAWSRSTIIRSRLAARSRRDSAAGSTIGIWTVTLGGLVLVALLADGHVLLEAANTEVVDRDCTAHAELNLVRAVSQHLAGRELSDCTVYASGEPCPMCAGALYWAGVGRVVLEV